MRTRWALRILRCLESSIVSENLQSKTVGVHRHTFTTIRSSCMLTTAHTTTSAGIRNRLLRSPATRKPQNIGRLIRSTVLASRWDAERPDSLGPDNPVLQAAGVKSWTTLERKALLILFELRDGTITVIPNRATLRGEGQGWIVLSDHIKLPDTCTECELGDAALRAFEMCVPWKPKR